MGCKERSCIKPVYFPFPFLFFVFFSWRNALFAKKVVKDKIEKTIACFLCCLFGEKKPDMNIANKIYWVPKTLSIFVCTKLSAPFCFYKGCDSILSFWFSCHNVLPVYFAFVLLAIENNPSDRSGKTNGKWYNKSQGPCWNCAFSNFSICLLLIHFR